MTKVFSHAGVSRLNGVMKARFANDAMRVKVLTKSGHTDIDLVEFLEPLSKEAAVLKLIEMGFGKGNTEIEQVLAAELDKRAPVVKAEKAPKVAKAPKAKAKPITIDTIKAKAPKAKAAPKVDADLEDAPF
jgi:hypothetical protein